MTLGVFFKDTVYITADIQ